MKRLYWAGWVLAGVMLVQSAAIGSASSAQDNPLNGHLLRHTGGATYLYHSGVKFAVDVVELGDQVIDAIPSGTAAQRDSLFGDGAQLMPVVPNRTPEPFPGHYS